MHAPLRKLALAAAVAALAATPAYAQTQWMNLEPRSSMRLEMSTGGQTLGFGHGFGSAVFATGRLALGARTWFVGEVPFAHAPGEDFMTVAGGRVYPDHRSSFGNLYLGLERTTRLAGLRGELGVRLPTVDPDQVDAIAFGRGSAVEHEDAFVARTLHLRAALGYHRAPRGRQSFGADVRVAPVWAIVTHNPIETYFGQYYQVHHTSRFLLDYDANARVQGPNARLAVGVAGRWAPVGSEMSDEPRSVAELTFLVEWIHLPVHPGVGLRIPLDGMQDTAFAASRQASVCFGMSVPFGGRNAITG